MMSRIIIYIKTNKKNDKQKSFFDAKYGKEEKKSLQEKSYAKIIKFMQKKKIKENYVNWVDFYNVNTLYVQICLLSHRIKLFAF